MNITDSFHRTCAIPLMICCRTETSLTAGWWVSFCSRWRTACVWLDLSLKSLWPGWRRTTPVRHKR